MRTASGIEIWSVQSGALQRTLSVSEGDGRFVALSPDEQWMLEVASDEETVWLRDVETGAIGRFLEHGLENRFATSACEINGKFSPDGRRVVTWLGAHAARPYPRIWDISDLTLQISIQQDGAFLELSWSAGKLETADEMGGPWTTLDEATSPHRVELNALRRFYRARKE